MRWMMKLIFGGVLVALGLVVWSVGVGALVLPPGIDGDCSGEVPIVVASDAAAQSDLYSAATLAGVLDTECIVLAGARGEPMEVAQVARLDAADAAGWIVGGTAAVPVEKVAGRSLKRLDGVDRWHTARLAGAVAADPDGDVAALTTETAPVAGAARGASVMVDGIEVRLPPGIDSDCAGQVPIVVAVDVDAQADLYSAATLAGVLDTTCIVLAGARGEAMSLAQRERLYAAKSEGWIVGGEAAVPPAKTAGYHLARQGGSDRWHTARLIGSAAVAQAAASGVDNEERRTPPVGVSISSRSSGRGGTSGAGSSRVSVGSSFPRNSGRSSTSRTPANTGGSPSDGGGVNTARCDNTYHVITHGDSGVFWSVVERAVQDAATAIGCEVVYFGSNNDAAAQSQAIEGAIADGSDGIAISLADPAGVSAAAEAVVAAGIPLYTLNSGVNNYIDLGAVTHIGQTEFVAGQGAGRRFNALGATKVLCARQEQTNVGLEERCGGLADTFNGEVISEFVGLDATPEDQASFISSALQADAAIDGVLGVGPVVALRALEAADTAGRNPGTDFWIGGFDLSGDLVDEIEAGRVAFTVDQQQYLQGYLSVILMHLQATNQNTAGGGLPVLSGPGFVTPENATAIKELVAAGTR